MSGPQETPVERRRRIIGPVAAEELERRLTREGRALGVVEGIDDFLDEMFRKHVLEPRREKARRQGMP